MFAPYCPTCRARVLLGPRRIVAAQLAGQPMSVHVRCFCGTVVAADNPVPPTLTVATGAVGPDIDRVA